MIDWAGKLVERLKPGPLLYGTILLLAAAFLALPTAARQFLGLQALNAQYRGWVAVAGLLAMAALAAHWIKALLEKRARVRELHDLTPGERAILRRYMDADTSTWTLSDTDGTVAGLVRRKILFRATPAGYSANMRAYNMEPWARHYLRQHPDLIADPRR